MIKYTERKRLRDLPNGSVCIIDNEGERMVCVVGWRDEHVCELIPLTQTDVISLWFEGKHLAKTVECISKVTVPIEHMVQRRYREDGGAHVLELAIIRKRE